MTKEELRIIELCCENLNLTYDEEKDIAVDNLHAWGDMNGKGCIDLYFHNGVEWIFDDNGYELNDCDIYLKDAISIKDKNWIQTFTDIKNDLLEKGYLYE